MASDCAKGLKHDIVDNYNKKERLLISLDGGFVDLLIGFGNKALEEGFLVLKPTFIFFHNSHEHL
jgi:hypothetical protein